MKPLIVLFSVFIVSAVTIKLLRGKYRFPLAGRIAMAAMLLFTAMGHFAFTEGMAMMVPDFLPYKTSIVYITGFIELVFAVGLLSPKYQTTVGWALIVFLLLVLPANIHAAMHHIDYQNATLDGPGLGYLWRRVPMQLLFIGWTYLFAISKWSNCDQD